MEINRKKHHDDIERARENSNLVRGGRRRKDIDIFGNTDPISTSKAYTTPSSVEPNIPEEPLTEDFFKSFSQPSTDTQPSSYNNTYGVEENTETVNATETNDVETAPVFADADYEEESEKKGKKEKVERFKVKNSKDAVITPEDIKESRAYAWLAYILFFIPLLINKNNEYVRHNANEGLEINIFDLIGGVLMLLNTFLNVSSTIGTFILLLGGIVGAGLLILTTITKIYMIVITLMGKRGNTPWFWNIRIIR